MTNIKFNRVVIQCLFFNFFIAVLLLVMVFVLLWSHKLRIAFLDSFHLIAFRSVLQMTKNKDIVLGQCGTAAFSKEVDEGAMCVLAVLAH